MRPRKTKRTLLNENSSVYYTSTDLQNLSGAVMSNTSRSVSKGLDGTSDAQFKLQNLNESTNTAYFSAPLDGDMSFTTANVNTNNLNVTNNDGEVTFDSLSLGDMADSINMESIQQDMSTLSLSNSVGDQPSMKDYQLAIVQYHLDKNGGDINKTAADLKISKSSIYNMLNRKGRYKK